MKKEFNKDSIEWQFQFDFWRFRQAFYEPEENEQYWEYVMEGANALCKKYASTPIAEYVKDVTMACLKDIERRRMLR